MLALFNSYTQVDIDNKLTYRELFYIDYCNIDGKIAYYSKCIDENCNINLYLTTEKNKAYVININSEYNNYNACGSTLISNIVTYKDTLFFVTSKKLLKYYYNKSSDSIEFINAIDLEKLFSRDILYYANNIYLNYPNIYCEKSDYNSKRLDEGVFYYFKINLQNIAENKFKKFEYPSGFYWSVVKPRNIIDFGRENYLITDITNYKIKVYNYNDSLVDSINRNVSFWKAETYDNDKFKNQHPAKIFEFITNDTLTKTLIHRVKFLTDRQILVCYSNNSDDSSDKLYDLYFDLWEKTNKGWELSSQDEKGVVALKNKYGVELEAQFHIIRNSLITPYVDEINEKNKLNILYYDNK